MPVMGGFLYNRNIVSQLQIPLSPLPKFNVWNPKNAGFPNSESPIQGCHFQVNHLKLWEGLMEEILHHLECMLYIMGKTTYQLVSRISSINSMASVFDAMAVA